jgi:WD40 repeat protein
MDKKVKLWQVATGLELATLPEHGRQVNTVAFAPDGKTLASGSHEGVVKLWKAGPMHEAAPR